MKRIKKSDILKKGAKLSGKKLNKKQYKEVLKLISEMEVQFIKERPLTFEELHTPFDI